MIEIVFNNKIGYFKFFIDFNCFLRGGEFLFFTQFTQLLIFTQLFV